LIDLVTARDREGALPYNGRMVIDPHRHPLLHQLAQGAEWVGKDAFPSCVEWADEHEAWLRFLTAAGGLGHYTPRLRGPKETRDEAFAEVAVAYFFATRCGLSILEWEPAGAGSKVGEFLMGFDRGSPVFVEVKSPGWEQEIVETEGRTSPRLQQPKYISGDARATAPWASVRHAVGKAYPKMPDTMPTLLVINDDLMVSLLDWSQGVSEVGLYTPKSPGHTTGYLAEDGPFVDRRCERLGGVGVFNVRLRSTVEYRFGLFENPHALPAVTVPRKVAEPFPPYAGGLPAPAMGGGEPWFGKVLRDEEWLRDPTAKAREEAMRVIGEFERRRAADETDRAQ
jgi:hypothetical protein